MMSDNSGWVSKSLVICFVGLLVSCFAPCLAIAQVPVSQTQLGTPKFASLGGGPVDTIDLANLNAHFVIPVFHKPGRGLPFNYDLTYDTTVWQHLNVAGTDAWIPAPNWGWSGSALNVGFTANTVRGYDSYGDYWSCESYYTDGFGTAHWFTAGTTYYGYWGCAAIDWCLGDLPLDDIASDFSGYTLAADLCDWVPGLGCVINLDSKGLPLAVERLTSADGSGIIPQSTFPLNPEVSPGSVIDRNGNEITVDSSGSYKDTLGMKVLTTSGGNPAPYTLTYTDSNGNPAEVTTTFRSYTVRTNFGCSGINEYGPVLQALVDRVTLPNGTYYQFSYEPTYMYSGDVTGRLASITLPTGGTISYTYTGGSQGITCNPSNGGIGDGSSSGLTRVTPDGTWTYSRTTPSNTGSSTTTITDPANNQTVIYFPGIYLPDAGTYTQGIYEAQRQMYQGSSTGGTLLETDTTCYNGNTSSCSSAASVSIPVTERDVTTQLGSVESRHVSSYNTYGLPTEVDDYDWGSSIGSLLKKTLYSYASLGNIQSFAQTITVCSASGSDSACGGTGTRIGQTINNYDERVPAATFNLPQHVNPSAPRGNLTSVQRWLNITGGTVTTQNIFFDTGTLQTSIDARNNPTAYSYSGAFAAAYPTQVTNALGQITINNYDANTGLLTSTIDPNGQTTTFSYDNILRPTLVSYPDGGQTTTCYTDEGGAACTYSSTPPFCTVDTTKITSSLNSSSTSCTDGLGRVTQTLTSDPSGTDYVDTAYDSFGRVYTVSNPYRSMSDATYGVTTYFYDALGRPCVSVLPGGTSETACPSSAPSGDVFVSYSGNCFTTTDGFGRSRTSCTDGLNRTFGVWEDPATNNYETDYAYDPLGDLTSVTQKGGTSSAYWRTRSFTYDSLGRLTAATTPESGTVCYGAYSGSTCQQNGYDGNGNLVTRTAPKENQTLSSTTVTTSYAYDPLNRLTQKSYNDGTTPTANYVYDGVAVPSGCSVGSFSYGNYPIGRRTAMCDGAGSEAWLYDTMGRVLSDQRITNATAAITGVTGYTYNYDGSMSSLSYPSGRTISYGINGAGQATSAVDSANGISYVTSASYTPFGAMSSFQNGSSIVGKLYYNNRLQLCRTAANSSGTSPTSCTDPSNSGNVFDQTYTFYSGSSNNDHVRSISNNRTGMSGRGVTYLYDPLNRVSDAYTVATSGNCWGEQYTIDAWGNLTSRNVEPGYSSCGFEYFSQAANSNNELATLCSPASCYDAAGNMLSDGVNSYTYDAEGHAISGGSVNYTYDGDGRRLEKSSGTVYWYDINNNVLDETTSSSSGTFTLKNEYVYFNGKRIAWRQVQ